ncbi:glycoside hydrolase family 2 TIM barrel-domain containing protein [Roseibacillus ishigakijimensis]|uniref:Beta-galactosidase n=1 Tax=Roseibacillus ishigakijimensis TaxID=454146 RepID=A0A934RTD7_9BACT|nr:glycoside hydrolase family 2 TIM barrel-domain containing protein [Roseibacillus ishigakijimensis]MBK1835286.1 hypothetical protein [Roseibacillus ishigakijimensis]
MKLFLAWVGFCGLLSAREVIPLGEGWRFFQGEVEGVIEESFDDSAWREVRVPHDWSIAGEFSESAPTGGAGGWLPSGVAWYRRTIALEPAGATWLEFDGVMAHAEVWWNGEKVGDRPYGYSGFRCDLTGKVRAGGNTLVVKADTSAQPASRWYTGAGIYRKVRLVSVDELHIVPESLFVTTPEVSAQEVEVTVALAFSRDLKAEERALAIVQDSSGQEVARGECLKGAASLTWSHPHLWSVEHPQLYHLLVRIEREGEVVDQVSERFGVRTAEFRSETGFWLNGHNLKLKGVCLHHDGGAVGAAVPQAVWRMRLGRLRELGVKAIRTAHNPVDPGFLDLCDEMGFLVMNEAFDCWTRGKNPHDYHRHFSEWWERDLRAMVRRDQNHPSVILYSVGNEIRDTHDAEKAKDILAGLVEVCHEEDPTRPVTQALFRPNTTHDYDNGLADLLDVIGTNYRDAELLQAWEDRKDRKIVGTEQGHNRSTWFACRDNPQHAGQFLWVGIDYLGEARSWPVTTFNAGLLDRTGEVNPRGWERQSWWGDAPMVKIFRRLAPTEATPEDPGYEVVEWKRRQVLFPDWNGEGSGARGVAHCWSCGGLEIDGGPNPGGPEL